MIYGSTGVVADENALQRHDERKGCQRKWVENSDLRGRTGLILLVIRVAAVEGRAVATEVAEAVQEERYN